MHGLGNDVAVGRQEDERGDEFVCCNMGLSVGALVSL